MDDRTFQYSVSLDFPDVLADRSRQRVYIEWRGLPLKSPPELKSLEPHRHVAVLKAWRESNCYLIKLQHPDLDYVSADYIINWIAKPNDGKIIVLLQLAPGWPGDGMPSLIMTTLVADKIVTLDGSEFSSSLAAIHAATEAGIGSPSEEAEALFGRMPDADSLEEQVQFAAQMRLMRAEEDLKQCCMECEKEVSDSDNFCASCGIRRAAPDCPECGKPVTTAKDARVRFNYENGRYPWHFGWTGKCINCNFDFSARLLILSGHEIFFSEHAHAIRQDAERNPGKYTNEKEFYAGRTNIDISMAQSVFSAYDYWDYQPTITFSLKRWRDANLESEGALKQYETFALTPAEWRALSEQLNGPLKVLLARQPWNRDTT
jgi:hypothetical protein